uniref:Uncharacterized protein n=1 Tax=Arcella intermedia TaxID=1963864 RepID=A0A6B2LH99_9EUKA
MIIMVGMPASGKTTFVTQYLLPKGYVHINRDTLKTQPKCLKMTKEALHNKKSVVIDNTNPSVEARSHYIQVAKSFSIPCRCFLMSTPMKLAAHLNGYRENKSNYQIKRIPETAYNVYESKFEKPKESEGFTEIRKINFVPVFENDKDKQIFLQFT